MTAALTERPRVPDILECLAQLSSDEVPTPPKLANAMLDLLPAEVWHDPGYRWLDPCSKSGVFLREIAKRLLFDGLVKWEPDFEKRREHIFRNMIYGCGITELTGIISRRTVYYSRHASSDHSVIDFDSDQGNIPFVRAEHNFKDGRCQVCGAPKDLERGEGRENYAYAFIHEAYPTEGMEDMKFDVIVGNPPYQVGSDGNSRTMPIYQHFVRRAIELDPRYVLMITPSRWFATGLGLDEYREVMLADPRIRHLVHHPNAGEVFPGVEIKGGVSYFLWDHDHSGRCAMTIARGSERYGPTERQLDEFDVLVQDSRALDILRKVLKQNEPSLTEILSVDKEFGMTSNFSAYSLAEASGTVPLYFVRERERTVGWVSDDTLTKSRHLIDTWKVLIPKAGSDGGKQPPDVVLGKPWIAPPPSVCTQTFLFVWVASEDEALSVESYVRTKFFRFLVSLRKIGQDATRSTYTWVPQQDWNQMWSDADLYERYGLTGDEIAFIESQVKEMPALEPAK